MPVTVADGMAVLADGAVATAMFRLPPVATANGPALVTLVTTAPTPGSPCNAATTAPLAVAL